MSTESKHHSIFGEFHRSVPKVEAPFDVNFLGAKVRTEYEVPVPGRDIFASGRSACTSRSDVTLPSGDSEDYLEWVDVLEAILDAKNRFVMIEAGAGYGRWLVNAAQAIRNLKRSSVKEYYFIGIEPDPTRFASMQQHFRDNGIAPEDHWLIRAGVSDKPGNFLQRLTGEPIHSYGDGLVHSDELDQFTMQLSSDQIMRAQSGHVVGRTVPCVTLSSILEKCQIVDLLDVDLQGEELRVTREAISQLDQKVKRVHYGTHSLEIEDGLREIFLGHDWICLNDYRLFEKSATPFGEIEFVDGIQSWINPRLVQFEVIQANRERLRGVTENVE